MTWSVNISSPKQILNPKKFKFVKELSYPSLIRIEEENKRFYQLTDGTKYPSVTTILSSEEKDGIEQWKKRVGEEEAEKILKRSAIRGAKLHKQAEYYLLGNFTALQETFKTPLDWSLFNSIKRLIDNNINELYGIEISLYSKQLKAAGTSDCIMRFQDEPYIADFKTARSPKDITLLDSYFMQCAAYAFMFEELTGIKINKGVLFFAYEWGDEEKFEQPLHKYLDKFVNLRLQYKEKYKI